MTRSRLAVVIVGVVLAVAIGGYIAYDQVLRGDSVAALTLPTAAPSKAPAAPAATAASQAGSSAVAASSAASGASTGAGGGSANLAGTWTVTSGSQAGYRVREQLANLPAESDAVGRTDKVSGSMTIETSGATTTLTGGTITVDTTSITSDKNMRDNRLRREGLQTDTFPTATFTLTAPVEVPAAAIAGTPTNVTLTGDLTLHGVTKSVQIPAQAQLADGKVQVAGSISFPLSDYAMTAPSIGGFIVSIADQGALEFLVAFDRRLTVYCHRRSCQGDIEPDRPIHDIDDQVGLDGGDHVVVEVRTAPHIGLRHQGSVAGGLDHEVDVCGAVRVTPERGQQPSDRSIVLDRVVAWEHGLDREATVAISPLAAAQVPWVESGVLVRVRPGRVRLPHVHDGAREGVATGRIGDPA